MGRGRRPLPALNSLTPLLGDLGIHHPTADPLSNFKEDELATWTRYFDQATALGFTLVNTPRVYTRFSMSVVGHLRVLDLAFACPLHAP